MQSILIKTVVVNLRKVEWISFQPNFYIVFQTGILENAPKTFLANSANIPLEQKPNLQKKIIKEYPNISIIDISRVLTTLLELAARVTWIILALTSFFLLTAVLIISFIIHSESKKRSWEVSLLKNLGYNNNRLVLNNLSEFFLLGFSACLSGIFLSYFCHYFINKYLFESLGNFSLSVALQLLLVTCFILFSVNIFSVYQILRQKIIYLLRTS